MNFWNIQKALGHHEIDTRTSEICKFHAHLRVLTAKLVRSNINTFAGCHDHTVKPSPQPFGRVIFISLS
jgi:hypothetical protein